MGIKRNDLAVGRKPCTECNGVGSTPGIACGRKNVGSCKDCKGRGWVLVKWERDAE